MENRKSKIEKVLLICSSCGKETNEGNSSKHLQKRVQKAAKESNEQLLVLLTSCFGVCPEEGTTIGYASKESDGIFIEVISDTLSEESIIKRT